MVAVTYGVAATASKSKGLFTMVFEAIAESQKKRAARELARYRHLLPQENEDEPFGGW